MYQLKKEQRFALFIYLLLLFLDLLHLEYTVLTPIKSDWWAESQALQCNRPDQVPKLSLQGTWPWVVKLSGEEETGLGKYSLDEFSLYAKKQMEPLDLIHAKKEKKKLLESWINVPLLQSPEISTDF